MLVGIKAETNQVIYADYDGPFTTFPDASEYQLSKDRKEAEKAFMAAVKTLRGVFHYYYMYNGKDTYWIVAAPKAPIGFSGPVASFSAAMHYGTTERNNRKSEKMQNARKSA